MANFLSPRLILTCEHGGNHVPAPYRSLFRNHKELLKTHRGLDIGALELAQTLSHSLKLPLYYSTVTRLLIDLNRSLDNPSLFFLETIDQKHVIENYYRPYRDKVEQEVQSGKVLHLSIHTFTPELNGVVRNADVGILYDPRSKGELNFAQHWIKKWRSFYPNYLVRRNYPYLGKSDGFATYLRKRYGEAGYLGIELEVNQKFPLGNKKEWKMMQQAVIHTFKEALGEL